mmetsp:Transcript_24695/g.52374  ORF Transcript_24695/g.52374 Transcript_24695/m.52374 type:complete len:105 (-) Transcript_24695:442-756(-)
MMLSLFEPYQLGGSSSRKQLDIGILKTTSPLLTGFFKHTPRSPHVDKYKLSTGSALNNLHIFVKQKEDMSPVEMILEAGAVDDEDGLDGDDDELLDEEEEPPPE